MNTKEVIISVSVLIILLVGLTLLLRAASKGNQNSQTGDASDLSKQNQESLTTSPNSSEIDEFEAREKAQDPKKAPQKNPQQPVAKAPLQSAPPEMQLVEGVDYKATIETSMGIITLDLFEKEAPLATNNFVYLAKKGFYDGLIFHRIINDFMIQGGDPEGTGRGGPGYSFKNDHNEKKLVLGSLAMANAGPDTNGSQFFIVTKKATPWLDGQYSNFGMVTEGIEVADAISKVATNAGDKPQKDVLIKSIKIIEN